MARLIPLDEVVKITGFMAKEIPLLIASSIEFPRPVTADDGTLMFYKARVMSWLEDIRKTDIPGSAVASLYHIPNGIFNCVCEDKSFPKPAAYTNCLFSEWNWEKF